MQFSSQLKVFVTDKETREVHQENRTFRFWFYHRDREEYVNSTHEFMRALLKSDEFPRGQSRSSGLTRASNERGVLRLSLVYQTINGFAARLCQHEKNPARHTDTERSAGRQRPSEYVRLPHFDRHCALRSSVQEESATIR